MKDYGNLDETSKPFGDAESASPPPGKGLGGKRTIRVVFNCCNVYSVVPIPSRVLKGELPSWRFHCPRCGQATEIPI